MTKLTHLTLVLVICSLNALAEQNSPRQGRYYDVFGDPLANLLHQNDVSTYAQNINEGPFAHLINQNNAVQFRQNLFGLSNINNAVNPFAVFFNKVPRPFIRNPNSPSLTNAWQPCKDNNGQEGTCLPSPLCSKFGGNPSGSCGLATVCCINSVSGCGEQVTLNNTYWRSPTTFPAGSTCGLTVTLDNNLIEQKTKICQVRLDFVSFTIAQPNSESVCAADSFRVGGATNNVPVICGENDGQHMYLTVPSPVSQLQLLFTFGSSAITRSWNVKISMLPCGASVLAPSDCLQYFSQSSGDVKSFNWKDTKATDTRQLANQDYKICFRPAIVNNAAANKLCITPCTTTAPNTAFALSVATKTLVQVNPTDPTSGPDAGKSQSGTFADCNNDYIILEDGNDPADSTKAPRDRFCGERLNVAAANPNSATVCSTAKPFTIVYRTNGAETVGNTVDSATAGNLGFCLSFTQRSL